MSNALEEAAKLLSENPERAGDKATEILGSEPQSDAARFILAASLRVRGRPAEALAVIEPVAARNPAAADIQHELALCLGATGRGDQAIEVLETLLAVDPSHAPAWRTLGDQRAAAGDESGSEAAFERHLATSTRHPELVDAARFLADGKLGQAERLTRSVLKKDPLDTGAIRMLAVIGLRVGQFDDAINLLERCLELAPGFQLARQNYAVALSRRQRLDESIAEIDRLLTVEPNNPNYKLLKGSFLVHKGDHDSALGIFETVLADYPNQSNAQMNYGHTLKAVGRVDEAIRAYRRAIELRPATGEVYWSLANLKTYRFNAAEIESMRSEVLPEGGDPDDQAHMLFALGKALEDRGDYDEAFSCYERGNRIRGRHHRHNAKINVFNTARQLRTLNADFFRERIGWGCMAPDPIFIVGLPRAGSTLLEQILSSHSAVEGTAELPDIIAISRKLGKRSRKHPAGDYPEILASLVEDQVRELGEGYIETTRIQRRGLPFFIDKMPNNFQHIGLIHLILPNSKIIDARRHPMAGCFSNFKQLFARGQTFTYNLTDLGHYYRDYVTLMDHWDEILPGRVHRVQYESMVSNTDSEIRALLDYCGLPFEEQCLRFFETQRAIRTPSSEQVRRPVYTEGVEQWRHFEGHLDPLKKALGPVLERYPAD
jgi:tetratricopeptide (TPR) repeat protein